MTLGIFMPAFVFPIFLHRQLVAVAENERLRPFLLGVAAGGDRADRGGHGRHRRDRASSTCRRRCSPSARFAVLNRWHGKLTVVYVVLGCGAIGALVQLVGLA